MQNAISNKIRLLLNELAILNQPEILDGNYFFDLATLKKLKTLSSELYLCSDQLVYGNSLPMDLEKVESQAEIIPNSIVTDLVEEVIPPNIPEVIVSVPSIENTLEIVAVEIEEKTPEIQPDVISVVAAPLDNVVVTEKSKVNIFDGKISLTRRFEYTNNLFSANADDFTRFLEEISNSNSLSTAIELFDREFETRGWKRKAEAASDLKQLIRKHKI